MDGGFTFFPHPDLWLGAGPEIMVGPAGTGVDTSIRVGGATTKAVAEIAVEGALVMPT